MKYEVLLADDDDSVRLVLSKALTRAGHTVRATDNADTLLKWALAGDGEIVLTDVMMGGHEVFDVLPELTQSRPNMPVIVISANNTVNTALKSGAHKVFEYVPKPFDLGEVTDAVSRAGKSVNPKRKNARPDLAKLPMIGRSPAMQPVYRAVSRFASGDLPVLIQGAVGTGKDLVARLLHDGGPRRDRPFLRVSDFSNMSLVLQKVNGGDIYVDEISSLSAEQQEGLLALMTEAENIPAHDRPRVLSATRKDLRLLAKDEAFRDDLLFRINVAEINLPPLSERGEDIYELAETFLTAMEPDKTRRFSKDALDRLHRHNWTGNVRELENLVRRLSVLYSDDVITGVMVAQEVLAGEDTASNPLQNDQLDVLLRETCLRLIHNSNDEGPSPHEQATALIEKPLITEALRVTGGNRAKAAERLGIHRNTLRTKLKALDIA
jgi:two-component system nitrogen regulation response regulator GlnG